jgi:putative flippase GtrA
MIRREVIVFLIVGSLTVLIDFLSYRGLVLSQLLNVDIAKAIGFLIGTLFAYFANRFWTFGHKMHISGTAIRFIFIYTLTLGANVVINAVSLTVFIDTPGAIEIAFLLATAISAILNFIGMKFFVFKADQFSVSQ